MDQIWKVSDDWLLRYGLKQNLKWNGNGNANANAKLSTISTANIKAVRGSLWWLSVNKLSPIPELQSVSAVYQNQWCQI